VATKKPSTNPAPKKSVPLDDDLYSWFEFYATLRHTDVEVALPCAIGRKALQEKLWKYATVIARAHTARLDVPASLSATRRHSG
jgi:hypothetical protein